MHAWSDCYNGEIFQVEEFVLGGMYTISSYKKLHCCGMQFTYLAVSSFLVWIIGYVFFQCSPPPTHTHTHTHTHMYTSPILQFLSTVQVCISCLLILYIIYSFSVFNTNCKPVGNQCSLLAVLVRNSCWICGVFFWMLHSKIEERSERTKVSLCRNVHEASCSVQYRTFNGVVHLSRSCFLCSADVLESAVLVISGLFVSSSTFQATFKKCTLCMHTCNNGCLVRNTEICPWLSGIQQFHKFSDLLQY